MLRLRFQRNRKISKPKCIGYLVEIATIILFGACINWAENEWRHNHQRGVKSFAKA